MGIVPDSVAKNVVVALTATDLAMVTNVAVANVAAASEVAISVVDQVVLAGPVAQAEDLVADAAVPVAQADTNS